MSSNNELLFCSVFPCLSLYNRTKKKKKRTKNGTKVKISSSWKKTFNSFDENSSLRGKFRMKIHQFSNRWQLLLSFLYCDSCWLVMKILKSDERSPMWWKFFALMTIHCNKFITLMICDLLVKLINFALLSLTILNHIHILPWGGWCKS